jgi:hypothetical protein
MTNDYMTTWLLLGGRGAPQLANNKHFFLSDRSISLYPTNLNGLFHMVNIHVLIAMRIPVLRDAALSIWLVAMKTKKND